MGQRASKRGVGSRGVPHRLNEMERKAFNIAKKKGYVSLRGTGWRSQRGDSPLYNLYRLYCDASNQPMVSLQRGVSSEQRNSDNDEKTTHSLHDKVTIDLSPLRRIDVQAEIEIIHKIMMQNDIAAHILSHSNAVDDTEGTQSDIEVVETSLQRDAIWQCIPQTLEICFLSEDRVHAKDFASRLVATLR